MSTLLLSDYHFSAIGAGILRLAKCGDHATEHAIITGLAGTVALRHGTQKAARNELQDWLSALREANRAAFHQAYPAEELPDPGPLDLDVKEPLTATGLCKLLDCTDYNTGGGTSPELDAMHRLRGRLALAIVRHTDSYDRAEWHL